MSPAFKRLIYNVRWEDEFICWKKLSEEKETYDEKLVAEKRVKALKGVDDERRVEYFSRKGRKKRLPKS